MPKIEEINESTDAIRTVQYTRWLLKFLGVWPMVSRQNSSKRAKYLSKTLILICTISLAFTIVPVSLHTILVERDPLRRLMLLGPLGFFFTNVLKYSLIIIRCETIKICVEHVERDWRRIKSEDEREIMRSKAKVGRRLTVVCGIFLYTGGASYNAVMPLWRGSTRNEFNETVRPLVYPGFDIFVNPQSTPAYEMIFLMTCVSAFVAYTVTTAACGLAAVFVTHACGQIEIVVSRLANLVDGDGCTRLDERISFVVRYHARALRLSSRIEEILREMCFVEFVASTLIICLLEYYCMTEWDNSDLLAIITYCILLVSLSFNIFIFCHIGQLLEEQCRRVGRAAYTSEWYRLPGKTGLALVMIIAIANCPPKLTAGRIMKLSIGSFGRILKSSIVYLNVLRCTIAK